MRSEKLLLMLVVVMFVAGPALALPLGYGETYQEWTFDDDDNPAEPESDPDLNPYGTAKAIIESGAGAAPPEWLLNFAGREGVWQAEPLVEITIEVPNQMVANPYKEIYVEIGFLGELDSFAAYPVPFGGIVRLMGPHEIEVVDPINGWKKLIASYRLEPNPGRERVCYSFSGAAAVDYVKINTVCVPEPLTVSLLGLGGLMLRRRRRTV